MKILYGKITQSSFKQPYRVDVIIPVFQRKNLKLAEGRHFDQGYVCSKKTEGQWYCHMTPKVRMFWFNNVLPSSP